MKLVAFSVQKYRSIVKAQKLPLMDLTILIGPNNEGKSNLLRALVVGMRVLSKTGNISPRRTRTKTVRLGRPRDFQETYVWEEDFPVSLRDQQPNGRTIFDFEFELDGPELIEFKEEFKSNLNGLLPIRLLIDRSGSVDVRVKKQGPAAAKLTQRSDRVARFIGMRLRPEYIPSVRTAEAALRVVDDMVSAELSAVQMTPEFQQAISGIEAVQRPVLNRISNTVRETLRGFLPEVVDVAVDVEDRQAVLRRNSRILVDDGTLTDLSLRETVFRASQPSP